jgi:hypothetical protein
MKNAFSPSAVDSPLAAFHVTCSADAGTLVGMPRIAVREQHDDRHCSVSYEDTGELADIGRLTSRVTHRAVQIDLCLQQVPE